jgi:hypothetical protein
MPALSSTNMSLSSVLNFSSQEPQITFSFFGRNAFLVYLNFDFEILLHFKMLEFCVCVLNVYSRNANNPLQISVPVYERNKEWLLKVRRSKL